jgi:hypothetical protein
MCQLLNKQKELAYFGVVEKMRLWTIQTKEKLSQVAKPTGLRGRITARFMVIGHRAIYKNVK